MYPVDELFHLIQWLFRTYTLKVESFTSTHFCKCSWIKLNFINFWKFRGCKNWNDSNIIFLLQISFRIVSINHVLTLFSVWSGVAVAGGWWWGVGVASRKISSYNLARGSDFRKICRYTKFQKWPGNYDFAAVKYK